MALIRGFLIIVAGMLAPAALCDCSDFPEQAVEDKVGSFLKVLSLLRMKAAFLNPSEEDFRYASLYGFSTHGAIRMIDCLMGVESEETCLLYGFIGSENGNTSGSSSPDMESPRTKQNPIAVMVTAYKNGENPSEDANVIQVFGAELAQQAKELFELAEKTGLLEAESSGVGIKAQNEEALQIFLQRSAVFWENVGKFVEGQVAASEASRLYHQNHMPKHNSNNAAKKSFPPAHNDGGSNKVKKPSSSSNASKPPSNTLQAPQIVRAKEKDSGRDFLRERTPASKDAAADSKRGTGQVNPLLAQSAIGTVHFSAEPETNTINHPNLFNPLSLGSALLSAATGNLPPQLISPSHLPSLPSHLPSLPSHLPSLPFLPPFPLNPLSIVQIFEELKRGSNQGTSSVTGAQEGNNHSPSLLAFLSTETPDKEDIVKNFSMTEADLF